MKEEHSYHSTKSASSSVPSNSVIIAVDKPEMLVTCFNSLSWATKRDGFSKPMSGALTLSQRSLQFIESLLQWLAHRFLKTAAVVANRLASTEARWVCADLNRGPVMGIAWILRAAPAWQQPEPTRFEAAGCRQARGGVESREDPTRSWQSKPRKLRWASPAAHHLPASGATFGHRHPRGERGVPPSFLTIWAEQRHRNKTTVSSEHLHSSWSRVIPRCRWYASIIVDWFGLWRAHDGHRDSFNSSYSANLIGNHPIPTLKAPIDFERRKSVPVLLLTLLRAHCARGHKKSIPTKDRVCADSGKTVHT